MPVKPVLKSLNVEHVVQLQSCVCPSVLQALLLGPLWLMNKLRLSKEEMAPFGVFCCWSFVYMTGPYTCVTRTTKEDGDSLSISTSGQSSTSCELQVFTAESFTRPDCPVSIVMGWFCSPQTPTGSVWRSTDQETVGWTGYGSSCRPVLPFWTGSVGCLVFKKQSDWIQCTSYSCRARVWSEIWRTSAGKRARELKGKRRRSVG